MKTSALKIHALTLGFSLLPVVGFAAQPVTTPPRVAAPLGLLRLQDAGKPGEVAKLVPSKFAVDGLPATGLAGVSKSIHDKLDTLVIEAGKEWSRPLRGAGREVTCASFQVSGSQTMIISFPSSNSVAMVAIATSYTTHPLSPTWSSAGRLATVGESQPYHTDDILAEACARAFEGTPVQRHRTEVVTHPSIS